MDQEQLGLPTISFTKRKLLESMAIEELSVTVSGRSLEESYRYLLTLIREG